MEIVSKFMQYAMYFEIVSKKFSTMKNVIGNVVNLYEE